MKGLDSCGILFPHHPETQRVFGSSAGLGTFRLRRIYQQGCRGILGPVPPPLSMNGWAMCAHFVPIVGEQFTICARGMSISPLENSGKTIFCLHILTFSLLK